MSRVLDLFIWSSSLLQIEVAVLSKDSILRFCLPAVQLGLWYRL